MAASASSASSPEARNDLDKIQETLRELSASLAASRTLLQEMHACLSAVNSRWGLASSS